MSDGIEGGIYEHTITANGRLSEWNSWAVLVDKVEDPKPTDEPRLTFAYHMVHEQLPGVHMELSSRVHDSLSDPRYISHKVRALPRSTRTINPPPPNPINEMTSVCTTTPHRPHEIKNQAHTLINSMRKDQRLVHTKFQPYLDRFIRGSVTNSLRGSIAERDLEITHREAIARAARKKLTGRVAQKGGVITVRDVRAKVTKRAETEVEKARRALERAEAAELKKENSMIAAHKKLWKQLHKELGLQLRVKASALKASRSIGPIELVIW